MGVGILSPDEIQKELLPESGHHRISRLSDKEFPSRQINTSAVDLPLGKECWEMRGSCRVSSDLQVGDLIRSHARAKCELSEEGKTLQRDNVYLIKSDVSIDLRGTRIQGKATARSSIGRLDVLVRLLGVETPEFDRLPKDTHGDLYLEVAPITFDLIVKPGTCLSQLRLFRGAEDLFTLTMDELAYEAPFPVVDATGEEIRLCKDKSRDTTYPFSVDLTPDRETGCHGFVAKNVSAEAIDPDKRDFYDPTEFWESVNIEEQTLFLEPGRLYILRSKERLRLPGNLAVECQAYTETLGEWRIEYAGFAHPYFGNSRKEGTPLIFEVRGHNVPTLLRDGLHLGNVSFRRMSTAATEPEAEEQQQYETQELKLSSCFKPWPKKSEDWS
jgi:dCTP deaminase